jgi:hypothetical protein
MTQQIKLQIPNGFEIDRENSTAEEIALKPIKKQLPKTWGELGVIHGYWVKDDCEIGNNSVIPPLLCCAETRNTFATGAQAKASIAMAQLSQLREVYRQGWKPKDYNPNRSEPKYWIGIINHDIVVSESFTLAQFLSFQSQEIAEEFLTNFKDLIIKAAPLLFGEEIKKH